MVNTTFSIYAIIFVGLLIGAGFISKKWVKESDDYIIAGREISFTINTLAVVAIGFAGTSIVLAPGFSLMFGVSGGILWGGIYALLGLMLYANIFANFIRRCGAQTLPEYFEMRYNGTVRGLVSITSVIGLSGILANNIVSLSGIVNSYTGWPIWMITAGAFLVILIFATMSGMWATTITDFIQVTIGTVAVPIFLMILISKFGGTTFLDTWKTGDWISTGISGMTLATTSFKYPSLLTFVLLFGASLVWGNNYYWIKMSSCRNEHVAKKSFTVGSLYLIFVFMIPLSFIGAYAGASTPEIFTLGGGSILPTAAYGVMAGTITPLLGSLFIVGASAAALSTSSTAALGATSMGTRDIYLRLVNPAASSEKKLKAGKMVMTLIILLTWFMTFFPGGPTYLFAFANAWLTPPAVLLFLGAFWPRFNTRGAVWSVISGMLSMVILTGLELTKVFVVSAYTHMAIVGFAITLVVGILAALSDKPNYFAHPEWQLQVGDYNRKKVSLTEFDQKVLAMINTGHQYMADLCDGLNVSSTVTNLSIEKLDQGGFIERAGLVGSKFYTFTVTEKAKKVLPQLDARSTLMLEDYLSPVYLDFLTIAAENSSVLGNFAKENKLGSLQMSSMISHLARRGYIKEKGLFKRRVEITQSGIQIIKKYASSQTA